MKLGVGVAVAVGVILFVGCGGDSGTGRHVSPAEQARLPTARFSLAEGLCPANYLEPGLAPKWQRQARDQYAALKQALRLHPRDLVTASGVLSDPEPGEKRVVHDEITVLELAKSHLIPLEGIVGSTPEERDRMGNYVFGSRAWQCRKDFQRDLGQLIAAAEKP